LLGFASLHILANNYQPLKWALELQGSIVHEETKLVVSAIESLKQEPNIFKDYIFPIASAFFTSILGAIIAYYTLNRQEYVQIEKEKMNASNKWTLDIEQARSNLIAIKGNYNGELTNLPIQRVGAIPSILFHAQPIPESFKDLSFIVPKESESKTDLPKWSQIPRIRAMISNYNYLLKLWEQRNEINQNFKELILASIGNNAYANLTLQQVEVAIGKANLVILIDLTERCITLTDDIIVELDSFLTEFPAFAKTKIDTKRLKKFGTVISYSNNGNEALLELIKKSPIVDFSTVEYLFGEKDADIKKRHKTGYE